MKKIVFFFCCILLTGCGCVLSQTIPPQNLFPGTNCTVPIPDYTQFFTITGGCTGFNVTQTPAAGTLLTTTNSPMTVVVKATSKTNGKFSQRSIIVNIADTITPKLVPIGILADYEADQAAKLYNAADQILCYLDKNLMSQSWIDTYPGLRNKLGDSTWYKKQLVIVSGPGYGSNGLMNRFISYADSVLLFNKVIQ